MPEHLQFRLIDAFADRAFSGNPAGVVLEADGLHERQMQQIAREVNASETAFVSRVNDLHRPTRLRWFTPSAEVSFCGHATLATAHALYEAGALAGLLERPEPTVQFETAAGVLTLRPEKLPDTDAPLWWLTMPDAGLKADRSNPKKTCDALGLTLDDLDPAMPLMRTRDDDVILVIESWQRLMELRPRFAELADWSQRCRVRGWCVTTLNTPAASVTTQSRFFAPAVGIDEDPVTGSVHGPLGVLLASKQLVPFASGVAALNCVQGQPGGRTGLVRVLVQPAHPAGAASIAGTCHSTIHGEIRVPAPAD